jgi:hypothetical protein
MVEIGGSDVAAIGVPPDAGTAPVPQGGTLIDGTYDLSAITQYGAGVVAGPTGDAYSETMEISGANADAGSFMLYDVVSSTSNTDRSTLETSVVAGNDGAASTELFAQNACPSSNTSSYQLGYTVVVAGDGGVAQLLFIYEKGGGVAEVSTYNKR